MSGKAEAEPMALPESYSGIAPAVWANPAKYALLVGAGGSKSAGIPLANEMVEMIARDWLEIDLCRAATPEEIDHCLATDPRFGSYESAVAMLGEHRAAHADYIRKLVAGRSPSEGHYALADLVAYGYFQRIFTTNFDRLIERALALSRWGLDPCILTPHMNCGVHEADLPIVVKLHGDCRFSNIRSLSAQTRQLEGSVSDAFADALHHLGLVVFGYGGSNDSIMRPLERMIRRRHSFPLGIYWLLREGVKEPPRVEELRQLGHDRYGERVTIVRIKSFDEFLTTLRDHLCRVNGYGPTPTPPRPKVPPDRPAPPPSRPKEPPDGGPLGVGSGSGPPVSPLLEQRLKRELRDGPLSRDTPDDILKPLIGPYEAFREVLGADAAKKEVVKALECEPEKLAIELGPGWNPKLIDDLRSMISQLEERLQEMEVRLKQQNMPPPRWYKRLLDLFGWRTSDKRRDGKSPEEAPDVR